MITEQQVLEQFAQISEHQGDSINPETPDGCVYTDAFGAHCLAGQILVNLGQRVPEYGEFYNADTSVIDLAQVWLIPIEPVALDLLASAQNAADQIVRWDVACAIAKQAVIDEGDSTMQRCNELVKKYLEGQ